MITDPSLLIRYLTSLIEKSLLNRPPCLNIVPKNPGVMNKFFVSVLLLTLLQLNTYAQETWDLERCIREALDKNLTIDQIELNKQTFDITGKQLRRERIPSLNASSDFGFTVGRVINPATNDFETENSLYQSLGIGTGLTLYNGGRINKSVRQNDIYVSASEKDIQQAQEDLSLNVALSYLNILFAYKNVDIAENRVKLSKDQLQNLDRMIAAGTRPENDRYDILSQLATDEQTLIKAQNTVINNLLALKQLMYMEADYPLEIERPALDINSLEPLENQTFDAVYAIALGNQPQIKAAELRQQASELSIDIARSQRIPSVNLGGNLGTNWSNFAKTPTGYSVDRITQPGVYINGDPALFEVDSYTPTGYDPVPYGKQLDQNIGYGWGATLSIPILNNYAFKGNVEKAKINVINADIETEKLKQTLKTNIQNALTSAKAARKSLEGAELAAQAAKIALDNADKKAAVGALNNFEYLSARNRSDIAESNLLIAQYDYYFQIKVLEYYMGRGISIN
jgi:outer membrane protein